MQSIRISDTSVQMDIDQINLKAKIADTSCSKYQYNSESFEGICNQNIQNITKCADVEWTKYQKFWYLEGICNQNIQNIAKCADLERTK